jgi:putative ABC transport system permease protein
MTPSIVFSLFLVQACRALLRNRLRSLLAAVAIMIGIGAVVCVVAIGRAGSQRAEETLLNLGDNFVQVEAGGRAPNGVRTGSHNTTSLTLEDAEAMLREIPQLKAVTPNIDGSVQLIYAERNWRTRWRGVSPDYLDIKRWPVALGAPFTDEDVRQSSGVLLIGQTVREKLFGEEDPLGKLIRVNAQLFKVAGVLAVKGQSAMGQDQDDAVIVPWTAGLHKIRGAKQVWLDDIYGSAVSAAAVETAVAEVKQLLRQRHHIGPGQEDDFNVRRPDEMLKAQIETSRTLEALLVSIALISLLVGGIGVMNVMLVSVTERTREIGLRLAVGATDGAVQLQFLGEAIVLSLFGGVLGVLLGLGGSWFIGRTLGWAMALPPDALVAAPLFSLLVGLVFGFYPARVASKLDPIEALRHE